MADPKKKSDETEQAVVTKTAAAPQVTAEQGPKVRIKNNHHQGLGYRLLDGPQNAHGRIVFDPAFGQVQEVPAEQAEFLLGLEYIKYDRESGRTETKKRFVRA